MDALTGAIANPQLSLGGQFAGSGSDDIISAIESLRQAIASMQIVMDSGDVVGAIQELINGALGQEARRAVWQ